VSSGFVVDELAAAPPTKAAACLELISGLRMLEAIPGTLDAAAFYIEHHLMPRGQAGDAAHLAIASTHGIDFLLTWNCKHLANANKVRHLTVLNARPGLHTPILATPDTLVREQPG